MENAYIAVLATPKMLPSDQWHTYPCFNSVGMKSVEQFSNIEWKQIEVNFTIKNTI